jgi:glycosyltransferase involved in cell wall biosynthesis
MTGAPSLSVVVPCYNARSTLAATLASVRAQGQSGLEIIVVDDGSRDGSADWLRETQPDVRVIEQANQGVAAARNTGIQQAQAPWVAFLDADDIWLPGKLAAQWQRLSEQPDCRLCYAAWQTWPSQAEQPEPALLAALLAPQAASAWAGASGWIYPELLLDCVVWTSTVLAQRSLLLELGGFDTRLRVGEDYDLWLRASRVTRIERVAQPLALYRLHPHSITRSLPTDNYRGRVIQHALSQWGLTGPDGRSAQAAAVQQGLAKSWVDYGCAHLAAGNRHEARRAVLQALRCSPAHLNAWKLGLRSSLPGSLS